jgi:dihydropyrimidinase
VLDLVIAGGRVVAPDGQLLPLDVGIRDGRIAALGRDITQAVREVTRADGCLVLPGVIDLHTHCRSPQGEPGLFTGETASAVAGGVTTIGDFAYPPGSRFEMDFEEKRERMEREALCDFCLHTVVRTPEQVKKVQTRTVKVFFTASGLGASAQGALDLLRQAVLDGRQVLAHVEEMADYLSIVQNGVPPDGPGRVHILHVPHQRFVSVVHGLGHPRITMETCPQYLLWEWTLRHQGCDVNPRIEPADLWPEVASGRISTIGTDHCSYKWQEKQALRLPVIPGVETLLRLMNTYGIESGRLSWAQLCRLLSSGPAQVLGLYPRKGTLQVGSDADVVVFDPDHSETMGVPAYGRADFSPFGGMQLGGRVVRTLVRGREVYAGGVARLELAGFGKWQDAYTSSTRDDTLRGASLREDSLREDSSKA